MIRLHLPDDLAAGARITLGPDATRYLLSVMRQAVGDAVLLFNGRHGEWRAVIAEAGKRSVVLQVDTRTRAQETGPDLDLLMALVKRTRLETIVEKAAELGARRVRLVITRRTQTDHTNAARLQAIGAEAAEQTGRLDVPEVVAPERLDRILDAWEPGRDLVFCDEAGDSQPLLDVLSSRQRDALSGTQGPQAAALDPVGPGSSLRSGRDDGIGRPAAILIGPEGGFAPEERDRLRALPFTTPVSLGPRILRADTAAVSALTLWQAAAGDWR
jgi:16S rRNA (uracil1498-N3)-methyltransferase